LSAAHYFLPWLVSLCVFASPCYADAGSENAAELYPAWRAKHTSEIAAFERFLRSHGVHNIVPTEQLLKTARFWQRCEAAPYTVPPKSLWRNLVPTLKVVKKLKHVGALPRPIGASVYRNPELNACAGGSDKSRHLMLSAIDFDIEASPSSLSTLCRQWRILGPKMKIGLGFYTPTRIHIDSTGFRTWGSNHQRDSSLCLSQK
jgi:Peptidase M15